MIIYNTTFHVAKGSDETFLKHLREVFIPHAIDDGTLSAPQLATVLARAEGDDGTSYSVQFHVADIDALQAWYARCGKALIDTLTAAMGNKVAGFTTLMQVLDTK